MRRDKDVYNEIRKLCDETDKVIAESLRIASEVYPDMLETYLRFTRKILIDTPTTLQ